MAIDPVCGMEVDEKTAKHKTEYKDETYYFCAPGSSSRLRKTPSRILGLTASPLPKCDVTQAARRRVLMGAASAGMPLFFDSIR